MSQIGHKNFISESPHSSVYGSSSLPVRVLESEFTSLLPRDSSLFAKSFRSEASFSLASILWLLEFLLLHVVSFVVLRSLSSSSSSSSSLAAFVVRRVSSQFSVSVRDDSC